MRFNGVVFPFQVRKLCQRLQAIAKNPQACVSRINIALKTEEKSEPFSHMSIISKVIIGQEGEFEDKEKFENYKIIIE